VLSVMVLAVSMEMQLLETGKVSQSMDRQRVMVSVRQRVDEWLVDQSVFEVLEYGINHNHIHSLTIPIPFDHHKYWGHSMLPFSTLHRDKHIDTFLRDRVR